MSARREKLEIHTWHNGFEWCACLGEYDEGVKVFTGRWQREAIDDLLDYFENGDGEIRK